MELWQAALLGLVEGITEYLPISSTGHLILVSGLMGLDETEETKAAVDAFNIVIQGGAILAVLGLYRARIGQMIRGLMGRDEGGRRLAFSLIIAFLPALFLGVLLDELIEAWLFSTGPVLAALALGGVYMIVLDRWRRKRPREEGSGVRLTELSIGAALLIGLMQTVAMWPGTSRSMMTITAGVLVGMRAKQAAEFSFLLGLPTLGGACVWKLAKDLSGEGPSMFEVIGVAPIIVGLLVATVSAMLAVQWLVSFLTRHGLRVFGWYRLALCAVLGGLIAAGVVRIGPEASAPPRAAPDPGEIGAGG